MKELFKNPLTFYVIGAIIALYLIYKVGSATSEGITELFKGDEEEQKRVAKAKHFLKVLNQRKFMTEELRPAWYKDRSADDWAAYQNKLKDNVMKWTQSGGLWSKRAKMLDEDFGTFTDDEQTIFYVFEQLPTQIEVFLFLEFFSDQFNLSPYQLLVQNLNDEELVELYEAIKIKPKF